MLLGAVTVTALLWECLMHAADVFMLVRSTTQAAGLVIIFCFLHNVRLGCTSLLYRTHYQAYTSCIIQSTAACTLC